MRISSADRSVRRHAGPRRAVVRAAVAWMALLAATSAVNATVTSQATTSSEAREEAIRALPFDQLTPTTQQKLQDVLSHTSMYRRMPVKVIACDADLYVFLVRYPEIVVNIWQVMGVTKVTTKRTGDFSLTASDGAGTASTVELVYGTRDKHVFYATATYSGPLTRRPIQARCVMLLQSGYIDSPDGRAFVASQLDVFIRFDHVGADLAARALHPLLGKTADYNFTESIGFLQQISQAAETNAYGVRQLAARLTSTEPAVRKYFSSLADQTSQKMSARLATPSPATLDPTAVHTATRSATVSGRNSAEPR